MWFFAIFTKIAGWLTGVNLSGLINGVTDVIKNSQNVGAQNHAADNKAGVELGTAYLQSVQQTNQVKLESRKIEGKWGPTILVTIVFFTIPLGIHFSAIVFDSIPLFGHVIGSWNISPLPKPFDQLEVEIIGSLFYIGGGLGAVSMIAKAFIRK